LPGKLLPLAPLFRPAGFVTTSITILPISADPPHASRIAAPR